MSMNKEETLTVVKKIGRGALLAGTGAVALYILDAVGKIDVGVFTPLIAAVIPILANAVREYMKGQKLAGIRIAGIGK